MITNGYACDMCGKAKGTGNHWWQVGVRHGKLSLWSWEDSLADGSEHFCGENCLFKRINEFLSSKDMLRKPN